MTSHVFMGTEGIKSFPLVAIIFVGFVILRSLMGEGVSISHRRQGGEKSDRSSQKEGLDRM